MFNCRSNISLIKIVSFVKKDKLKNTEQSLELGVTAYSEIGTITGITVSEIKDLKRYKDIHVSNDVYLLGYPFSLTGENPDYDPSIPLLRKGIVAGKNDKNHTIILDCPSYKGNSGGPVFERDINVNDKDCLICMKLIGIVSQFVPLVEKWKSSVYGYENINLANSGYTVIVPLDDVLDFLGKK